MWRQKKAVQVHSGAIIFNQSLLGTIFAQIFMEF